jgi:hypothetical protein
MKQVLALVFTVLSAAATGQGKAVKAMADQVCDCVADKASTAGSFSFETNGGDCLSGISGKTLTKVAKEFGYKGKVADFAQFPIEYHDRLINELSVALMSGCPGFKDEMEARNGVNLAYDPKFQLSESLTEQLADQTCGCIQERNEEQEGLATDCLVESLYARKDEICKETGTDADSFGNDSSLIEAVTVQVTMKAITTCEAFMKLLQKK